MFELSKEDIKRFAFGGNATITLQSPITHAYYTYKITRQSSDHNTYMVERLYGPDNSSDFKYIGTYYKYEKFFHTTVEINNKQPTVFKVIRYFFKHIDELPDKRMLVYHEGKCARCGRKLTTPDSIKSGFGPHCRSYYGR